jgi:hypothetical protein
LCRQRRSSRRPPAPTCHVVARRAAVRKPARGRFVALMPCSRSRRCRVSTRSGFGTGTRGAADGRGAGHRLRPVQSARQGLSDGKDRRDNGIRHERFSQRRSALRRGEPESESRVRRMADHVRRAETGDSRADRAGVVAGAEAVDCSDPQVVGEKGISTCRESRSSGPGTTPSPWSLSSERALACAAASCRQALPDAVRIRGLAYWSNELP